MKDIDNNATVPNFIKIIVGLKCDLDSQKEVPFKQGQKFAKENGAHYFECSAKEGTNVHEMFQIISNTLFQIQSTCGFSQHADLWGPSHGKKIKLDGKKSSGKKRNKKGGKKGKLGCC